jgi:filamentous hemagglutinin family protein
MKKKPYCNSITFLAACIIITALLTNNAEAVNTQIQTDKTLQGITALNVDAPGDNQVYTLSEIHGKTAGKNLFYSFSNFNIGATDTAWFNLNSPDLANVISRVTGGSESFIEGALKMTNDGSAPAFFFINSAGITFGAGASVDVPGAFYASTASALNLDDGSQYLSNETDVSTLSAADPESFGFLGDESGKINIGSETARTNLTFESGTDVGLIANQIQIENTDVMNADTSQAGLNIQIVATGEEAAQIKLGALVDDQAIAGNLDIQNSRIVASGNGSGHLAIQSGNFTASNSNLSVDNTGDISMTTAHGINVSIQSQLLLDNNTSLSNNVLGTGNAGLVDVKGDSIILSNGGLISSNTFSQGNAGAVTVSSNKMKIEGPSTGITSQSGANIIENTGSGDAGNVTVLVTDKLQLINRGSINSDTFTKGKAGEVSVTAGQLELDVVGNISSDTSNPTSNNQKAIGDAGNVTVVVAGTLKMSEASSITSNTFSKGNAGSVTIMANNLEIDGFTSTISTISGFNGNDGNIFFDNAGDAGDVMITVSDTITLTNHGRIRSSTTSEGKGGDLTIIAKNLEINSTGAGITGILNNTTNFDQEGSPADGGDAGNITIGVTDMLRLVGSSANINSGTLSKGNAGDVRITAGQLEINGRNPRSRNFSGILSQSSSNNSSTNIAEDVGDAGDVTVTVAGTLKLINGGAIRTDTFNSTGNAGTVNVSSNELKIEGSSSAITSESRTDIIDDAFSGDAGNVVVTLTEKLTLGDGGEISSNTHSQGDAGTVIVKAKQVEIDGTGGIFSEAEIDSDGDAGSVDVKATESLIINNGRISASAHDVSKEKFSGFVRVIADSVVLTNGGEIVSSTSGAGDAGSVVIQARQIDVSGVKSGITSNADDDSSGNAGEIIVVGVESKVQEAIDSAEDIKELIRERPTDESLDSEFTEVEMLSIISEGLISSSTSGSGDAGSILIQAKQANINGLGKVTSDAEEGSKGDAGYVDIKATESLIIKNNGKISARAIDSSKGEFSGFVRVIADSIVLTNGGEIVSSASGAGDAGEIFIIFTDQLLLNDQSELSTLASGGNGGSITISGGKLFRLYNSSVMTSVLDQFGSGNGGDITVKANSLVMNNGFIQANTEASGGSGGNIIGDKVLALVPSNDFLQVGGEAAEFLPFAGRNVIQAVAPNGVSGNPIIGVPQLNLSGVLADLTIEPIDSNAMNRNMCTVEEGSSLLPSGRGGMRMRARDFMLSPIP